MIHIPSDTRSPKQIKQHKLFVELGTLHRLSHLLHNYCNSPRNTRKPTVFKDSLGDAYIAICNSINEIESELATMKKETEEAKKK